MKSKEFWSIPNFYCQYYSVNELCHCTDVKDDVNNEQHQNTTGKCAFKVCPIRKRKIDAKKIIANIPKIRESVVLGKNVSQKDVKPKCP